jgi:hypothetical protein
VTALSSFRKLIVIGPDSDKPLTLLQGMGVLKVIPYRTSINVEHAVQAVYFLRHVSKGLRHYRLSFGPVPDAGWRRGAVLTCISALRRPFLSIDLCRGRAHRLTQSSTGTKLRHIPLNVCSLTKNACCCHIGTRCLPWLSKFKVQTKRNDEYTI